MYPLYEPLLVFPRFEPLTAPGIALCVDIGPKMSKFILLSLRLSGNELSLVSD